MDIQTKKQPKNLIEIIVEIPVEEVDSFEKKALQELSQEKNIKGFRPGKAPLDLVKKELEETKIMEKTAEIAINEKYPKILKEQKITPAAPPEIEIQKLAPHNPLIFKLKISLMPNIRLGDYKKIKIKTEKIEIDEKEVEKILEELKKMRRKEKITDRPAKTGDKVKADLQLFADNVPLENGQIKDFSFILGEDKFLPASVLDNLKNSKKGDKKEFSYNYPGDHYDKKLAGKKIDFKAEIKEIYEIELPELNDELAKNMGPFKNLQGLKGKIKENLLKEKTLQESQKQEIKILEKIIEKSEFDEIPDILIEHELDKMILELKNNVENPNNPMSPKFEDYLKAINKTEDDLRKDFISKAEQRIKTAIAIREIAKKEEIKTTREETEKEMEKMKKVYQGKEQILKNIESETGKIYIENLIVNQKVIDLLKKQILQ